MTASAQGKLFNDLRPSRAIAYLSSWHIYSQIYSRMRMNSSKLSRKLIVDRKQHSIDIDVVFQQNNKGRYISYREKKIVHS